MWQNIVHGATSFIVNSLIFLNENVTHNYGWSIILLTLIFRILILPLTFKSIKSMKAMQELQPKMKELQEKYKNDREALAKKQMELFKEHGANPMGGCLPMLLQLPIFILLFRVLNTPELNGFILVNSSFYGMDLTTAAFTRIPPAFLRGMTLAMPGMIDLSVINVGFFQNAYLYLPTLILAAGMAVTTIIQQKQMIVDPNQKGMMMMMNLMLIYFAAIMPSGVLLYWVLGNLFQIVQQKFTGPLTPQAAAAGKPVSAKEQNNSGAKGKNGAQSAAAVPATQAAAQSKKKKKRGKK